MSTSKMRFNFGKMPAHEFDDDVDSEGNVSDEGSDGDNHTATKGKPTRRRRADVMSDIDSEEETPVVVKKRTSAGSKAESHAKTKFGSKAKPNLPSSTSSKNAAANGRATNTAQERSGTKNKQSKPKAKVAEETDESDLSDEPDEMERTSKKGKKGKTEKPKKPVFAPTPNNSKASHLKRTLSFPDLEDHEGRRTLNMFNKLSKAEGEHDPENHEIMRLRDEEKMSFGDIAQRINEQRVARGRLPSLTDNAIYSRYMRNAPLIAAAMGKEWEPVSLNPKKPVGENVKRHKPIKFTAEQDELLVRVYKEVVEETWETVSKRFKERGGPKTDAVTCARRYNML